MKQTHASIVFVLTFLVTFNLQFVNSSTVEDNVKHEHALSSVDRRLIEQLMARVDSLETKVLDQKQELDEVKAELAEVKLR